jgi:hypothetical protein
VVYEWPPGIAAWLYGQQGAAQVTGWGTFLLLGALVGAALYFLRRLRTPEI